MLAPKVHKFSHSVRHSRHTLSDDRQIREDRKVLILNSTAEAFRGLEQQGALNKGYRITTIKKYN